MRMLCAAVVILLATTFCAQLLSAQQMPTPKSLDDLVKWVNAHNKAPFDRDAAQLPNKASEPVEGIAPDVEFGCQI